MCISTQMPQKQVSGEHVMEPNVVDHGHPQKVHCFVHKLSNNHVRINIDNTAAVSSINHKGTSHSQLCNQAAAELWPWCIENHIWVSAAHIARKLPGWCTA